MDIRSVILTGLIPITTSLFCPTSNLNAADLKYTYAEAKYFVSSDSAAADDADGFGFNGSYRINNNLFALAEFSNVEGDEIEVETQRIFGGLGYIHPINNRWNSEFIFVFGKIDLDVPRGTRDQNGRSISDDDDTGYILKLAHTPCFLSNWNYALMFAINRSSMTTGHRSSSAPITTSTPTSLQAWIL